MMRIMSVCTGNVCRSPYVEARLGAALEELAPGRFEVVSTGTAALEGAPAEPGTRAELERRGLSASGLRGVQTTARALEASDLVLTAQASQVEEVLRMSPRMLKRTFTLPEFAALLPDPAAAEAAGIRPGDGPRRTQQRWRRLAEAMSSRRAGLDDGSYDIADPYRRGSRAFQVMAADIDASVDRIVAWERSMQGRAPIDGSRTGRRRA